MMFGGFE